MSSSLAEESAFLARARDSLLEAQELLGRGHRLGSISRAYYAMYQSAQAVLCHTGEKAKTHKGLRLRLEEKDLLDTEARAILARAQTLREQADYDVSFDATDDQARRTVEEAQVFLARVDAALAD